MTDPYVTLREQLLVAARRLESPATGHGRVRTWLSRRRNAWLAAVTVLLSGGAVALAASGLLSGAPVRPERPPNATAGNGLPVSGASLAPAVTVADPGGGLAWGARVFRTTRGQVCIQVGRVRSGELGELGLDSAFGSDGRFHRLPANVLPPSYGGASSQGECIPAGRTVVVENARADRSGAELLPEEFPPERGTKHRKVPPLADLRALAYGVLGPHAVSVTFRTPAGLRVVPVTRGEGAFLIVEPAGYFKSSSLIGGSIEGRAEAGSVLVLPPRRPDTSILSVATFRFGAKLCSEGAGAPVAARCPQRRAAPPRRWYQPTRSLRSPVHLTLLRQSSTACRHAFLLIPCYRGEVSFTAPYAVENAVADYSIEPVARCRVGGRPEGGEVLGHDVARHERIRTVLLGLFVFTPACVASEAFRVVYLNTAGPSAAAPHESVIVGQVSMSRARLPGGGAPARPQSR
jgi:hypothetical protein